MVGGSKVREWMRRRMAPRKAAGSKTGGSDAAAAEASSAQSSPRSKLRTGALSSALRWRKPRGGNVLAALFQRAAYHLLWLVESVVVVARLLVFFVRFGFRL